MIWLPLRHAVRRAQGGFSGWRLFAMADYLPVSDLEFKAWADNFLNIAAIDPPVFGLVAADITPVTTAKGAFDSALTDNQTAQNEARTRRQIKDDARAKVETGIRSLVRRIQVHPGTTGAQRTSLGITVRDGTASPASAAALAATRPWASVDTSQRLRHTIDFRDNGTKDRRAKPAGVKACEIWVKIGSAPTNPPADMQFLALDTATPYVAEYDLADAGKVAYYMLRWVNSKDEKGPWGETVEATIVG